MQQHFPTILKCNSHAHDPTLPNSNQFKLNSDKHKINIPQNVNNQQSEITSNMIHIHFSSSFNQIVDNQNYNKLLKLKTDAKRIKRDNETIDTGF